LNLTGLSQSPVASFFFFDDDDPSGSITKVNLFAKWI